MKKVLFILLAVMSTATMFAAEEAATEQTNTTAETLSADVPYIWRGGKDFYAGKTLLTKEECQALLKLNCPEAFRQYDKGQKLIKAGWSVFGVGMLCAVASGVSIALPVFYDPDENGMHDCATSEFHKYESNCILAAQLLLISGSALVGSSIPILCVGYTNRNNSVMTYNTRNSKHEPAITYNITAGQNGLGLAINF